MSSLLLLHILGGILSMMTVFGSVIILIQDRKSIYPFFLKTLSFMTAFQVLSGTFLAYSSPSVSAQSLCANLGLYLGLIVITYGGFIYRMKPNFQNVLQTIALPIGSLGIFALALIQGV